MEYYVYTLIDSRTGRIFYVGKGCKNRMYMHVNDVKRGRTPNSTNAYLGRKIKKILDSGIKYKKIFITENEREAYDKEKDIISKIGLENLCNITTGGEGGQKERLTQSHKEKISKSLKGHKVSDITKEKISKANKKAYKEGRHEITCLHNWTDKKHNEETKKKISEKNKGKIPWNKGIARSERTKRKISESLKGNIPWNKNLRLKP